MRGPEIGIAVALPGVIVFIALISCFVVYERLVKRQYEIARDAWEADGRPPGVFWAPAGTSVMRSWTRGGALTRWLWSSPSWVTADKKARELQRALRIAGAVGLLAWLWLAVVFFAQ
jgi:hypothetical protein